MNNQAPSIMRFLIFGDIITLTYCLGNYTYKAIQIILEVGHGWDHILCHLNEADHSGPSESTAANDPPSLNLIELIKLQFPCS